MARRTDATVAYRVLADELREAITADAYAGGRRLPTEAELASSHEVSRQTVRRAMQELVAEGYVYRVPGRGTFVDDRGHRYLRQLGSIEDLLNLSVDSQLEVVTPLQRRVDVEAASRLRLDSDTLYCLTFRRVHQGAPVCYTSTFLPPGVGRMLADMAELTTTGAKTPTTIIGLVETRTDGLIVAADQSITVGRVPSAAAREIQCEPGDPVLRIDRLYFDQHDRPVELAINWYNPETYTYRVRLQRSQH
jgi:GntR family transcriptional regulator